MRTILSCATYLSTRSKNRWLTSWSRNSNSSCKMHLKVNQVSLISPSTTQSCQWTNETCSGKSKWASRLWRKSRAYWYGTYLQMQPRMQVSSSANRHRLCSSSLGLKNRREALYWTTSRSRTSQSTWTCSVTCAGYCYTDLVSMVCQWTPSYKNCKVQMPLSW